MLNETLAASFDLIWTVENNPVLSILRYAVNNNPLNTDDLNSIQPYQILQEDLRCIFSGSPKDGDVDNDILTYDLTVFVKEEEINFTVSRKLIIKFEDRLYKLIDKEPNYIFGLIEFNLMRVD